MAQRSAGTSLMASTDSKILSQYCSRFFASAKTDAIPIMAIGHSCKREFNSCSSIFSFESVIGIFLFAIGTFLLAIRNCSPVRILLHFRYQNHLRHRRCHSIIENDLKIRCNYPPKYGGYGMEPW